jgi:hypothetical protein
MYEVVPSSPRIPVATGVSNGPDAVRSVMLLRK